MAEDEVVAVSVPLVDHKRRLEEVDVEALERSAGPSDVSNAEPVGDSVEDSVVPLDSSLAKRPKLDEDADGLDIVHLEENCSSADEIKEHHEEEKREESQPQEEETEKPTEQKDENQDGDGPSAEETHESLDAKEDEEKMDDKDQPVNDNSKPEAEQEALVESAASQEDGTEGSKEASDGNSEKEADETQSTSRRMDVPSSKAGMLIGKGGDTIRYLQSQSGAKIQFLRDADAHPNSVLRPVEIIGTAASVEKAEKLINAIIAEAEAGGPSALVARGFPAMKAIGVPEQIEIKVPIDQVGPIIGRGGETIKNMQTRSGARIRFLPKHEEVNGSKERTVRISGDKRQIDIASDMIKDAMHQIAQPSRYSGGYNRFNNQPFGSRSPTQWGPRGPQGPHLMSPSYHQRRPYQPQNSLYNPPCYGDYPPQHMPPWSGYGAGWDPRPSQAGPYEYYGRQGSQISGRGPGYGHAAPYSQPKNDNPIMQPPFGGHGGYQHAGGGQQGAYAQPQQPGRVYGMQGPAPQTYGPPRAAIPPREMAYQGAAPAPPSYAGPQQQFAYASSGPMQQAYPSYGSVAPTDGYHVTQDPAPPHGQSVAHQAAVGYAQVPATGAYSSYPTSQSAPNSGNNGYSRSQDPSYAANLGVQPTYSQAAPAQAGYEQSVTQPAGYAAAPWNA